jgi:hypothetical protein
MSISPPRLRLPDPVREDLNAQRAGLADEIEETLYSVAKPCVAITALRVSDAPLHRGPVRKLLGARTAVPVLGPTASKFGGIPYCETVEDWSHHAFLGQIDLAEATAVLPQDGVKLRGLLRIDNKPASSWTEAMRVRWFAEPSARRAITAVPPSVGKWETRLAFKLSWTIPEGKSLEALWPLKEPKWYDYEAFFPTGYNADGFDEFHRMLGHKSSGLDEHYGINPPRDFTDDIDAYECLLRLTFDNNAGFGWGTNWIYLLVPREDLKRGDLSRITVTGANS